MKKKIISLLILALSTNLVGCSKAKQTEKIKEEISQEFELVSNNKINDAKIEGHILDYVNLIIVKHKETGKRFIIYHDYKRGGICPLD